MFLNIRDENADVSIPDTPPPPASATISILVPPPPLRSADVVYGRSHCVFVYSDVPNTHAARLSVLGTFSL